MTETLMLALDRTTTSTRTMVFTLCGKVLMQASRPLEQIYPVGGWVEHDVEQIFHCAVEVTRGLFSSAAVEAPAAMGAG